MDRPQFVYVNEIVTTPEKLWEALTSQDFWRQFSGPVESDWKQGSPIRFYLPDGKLYSQGVVLEADPPRLLIHTWPDPEGEQTSDQAQRLTWRVERLGPSTVKLTLVHENMTGEAYDGVKSGWPLLLEGLKRSIEGASAIPNVV